jgi:DNA-binding NarL/FixJ family response regulator
MSPPSPATSSSPPRVRVVVADDNADLCAVMRHVLDAEPDLCCVGTVDSVARVAGVARDAAADVVVLDGRLRDGSGLDAIALLAAAAPATAIVFYSGFSQPELANEALRRGAAAVVSKSADVDVLLDEIRRLRPAAVADSPVPAPRGGDIG